MNNFHPRGSVYLMFSSADLVGKIIMIVLILASLVSWAIIFTRYIVYGSTLKKMRSFENHVWSGQMLDTLYDHVRRSAEDNPLSLIFMAAMGELKRGQQNLGLQFSHNLQNFSQSQPLHPVAEKSQDTLIHQTQMINSLKERILNSMHIVRNREIEKLQGSLGLLGTIGSAAPFIGLLGMVWAVMTTFLSIGAVKNVSLATIAPGIAESLLVTGIGLFVAIPSVMFYNFLSLKLDKIHNIVDDFIIELHTTLSRLMDEKKML